MNLINFCILQLICEKIVSTFKFWLVLGDITFEKVDLSAHTDLLGDVWPLLFKLGT